MLPSLLVCLTATIGSSPEVHLREPVYRDLLFPGDQRVILELSDELAASQKKYSATWKSADGKVTKLSTTGDAAKTVTLEVPDLEPGEYEIRFAMGDAVSAKIRVRKLDQRAASKIAAYVDRHGRLIWKGKPLFVNGWYSDGTIEKLRQIADSPFNAVLDYGMTSRSVEETKAYLAEAEKLGVALLMCVNDVYPSATYRKKLGDWVGNDAILEGVVKAYRDSSAVVLWYNNDEIDAKKRPELEGYYRLIRELDPNHPQLMVHFKKGGLEAFQGAADIFGVDHYPIPKKGPLSVAEHVDWAKSEIRTGRPTWVVAQNFAWYQHREIQKPVFEGDRKTTRARLPTPAEWKDGRPPTREEVRAMTYLSLTHGGQGLLYWCLYNLDFLPDRAERWRFSCEIAEEVEELSPVLLEPVGERVEFADPAIHALAKDHKGRRYVIAVNASDQPLRTSFTTGSAGSSADVLFEKREVRISEGKLTDFFPPYGRHVYSLVR
jgi:hypothetical protein